MDDNVTFADAILDITAPQLLSIFAANDLDRDRMMKLAELCRKYRVSFISFVKLIDELDKWEKERAML